MAACGGGITGTWKLDSICWSGAATVAQQGACSITIALAVSSASGSMTFNTDGTYTSVRNEVYSATFGVGAACLSATGVTKTCPQEESALNASLPVLAGVTYSPFTCSPVLGGGCSCTVGITDSNYQESGTYTTVGSMLTETPSTGPSAGTPVPLTYCVQGGSALTIVGSTQSVSMGSMGSIGLTGVSALTKQ